MTTRAGIASITSTRPLKLEVRKPRLGNGLGRVERETESKMPVVNLETKEVGCRKPGCKRRMEPTARHHRKCESMFIRGFAHIPSKCDSRRYKRFKTRYESFNPRDVVVLCAWHHCEIHLIYDRIIDAYRRREFRILTDFTWEQADGLMAHLKDVCREWEQRDTPGRNPVDCVPTKRFPKLIRVPKKKRKRKRKKNVAKSS